MVSILYDIQHYELVSGSRFRVQEVERTHGISVHLDICDGFLLEKNLAENDYDIVLLHMGQNGEGAFRTQEICRKVARPNTKFVAESSLYPSDMKEVLKHFDHYMPLLIEEGSLEELLRHYEFIS